MIKAILFDLDGTLVDTLADIATVMNGFLRSRHWPEHTLEDYRHMVGRGLMTLIRTAVPETYTAQAEELYDEVFSVYDAMGIGESRPYPGTKEVLESLNSTGIPIAVVSNKPDEIARKMMDCLFSGIQFALVRGGQDGVAPKPDPSSSFEAARACKIDPANCAFVGDSDVDMKTALAAGMLPVGAAWGFRGEAELRAAGAVVIAASIAEIPALLSLKIKH